jgi:hypothetical protein
MSTASFTAFIYAGAIQSPALHNDSSVMDNWSGHVGFVAHVEEYAEVIAHWIDCRDPGEFELWVGVIEYELFEPMGEWLLTLESPPTAQFVLEHFEIEYVQWLAAGALEINHGN